MSAKPVSKQNKRSYFLNSKSIVSSGLFGIIALGVVLCSERTIAASVDNIQVLGTVTGPNKNSNYAIIIIDKAEPSNFKKGQTVVPGYVLDKIYDDKITLKHGAQSLDIKIGVPFSSEDFNVESSMPPAYEQAPIVEPPPPPPPPPTPQEVAPQEMAPQEMTPEDAGDSQ